jgi:UDP-N-acetylglucosamine 2-epimerase (non-hydrolysing)
MSSRHALVIFGTRPEFIKLAPVILALKRRTDLKTTVCNVGQHEELLGVVLDAFPIKADMELSLMQPDQSLWGFAGRAIERLGTLVATTKPDFVIAQGDTATTLAAAWAAFYNRVPFVHIEAGLRTGDLQNPFPEEANRIVISQLTTHHFSPTENARSNLLKESVDPSRITVTGNTVVDALEILKPILPRQSLVKSDERSVLVTIHRRENFGAPAGSVCRAIRTLADKYQQLRFIIPVHPNPGIRGTIHELLGGHSRIDLIDPLNYTELLCLLRDCFLVMTDSGGLQEEAPSFGRAVLVLRSVTERPEAVDAGFARIVGASEKIIVAAVDSLLTDNDAYNKMCAKVSPFGDGDAANRIVEKIMTL